MSRLVESGYKDIDEVELTSCSEVEFDDDHHLNNDQNNINNYFDKYNNKVNASFDYETNETSRLVETECKNIDEVELTSCSEVESDDDHRLKNDQKNINNSIVQNNNKVNKIVLWEIILSKTFFLISRHEGKINLKRAVSRVLCLYHC